MVKAAELYQLRVENQPRNDTARQLYSDRPTVLSQQAEVEAEANRWAAEWNETARYDCPFPDSFAAPPPRVAQALLMAASSFAPMTGLGGDNTTPRAFRRLTQEALEGLARLLAACEACGRWPEAFAFVLIVLLPEPDGGRRPIGLFDAKIRLWMRMRSNLSRMWEAANPSPAIFGGRGCGAQRAAWLSSLTAECAALANVEFAQTLIDLVKAFERVPHHILVTFAVKWNYNIVVLRLSLAAYRIARAIGIDGVFSRLVVATRGTTAGAGMATSELRPFMLDLIKSRTKMFLQVGHVLYVDDLTLEASGDGPPALNQLAAATNFAVQYLEGHLLAPVSPAKSVFLGSSRRATLLVRRKLITKKVKRVSSSKMLGVQTAGGRRRRTSILRQRLELFRKKVPRIQKLRMAGINVKQVTRAAGAPAFFYGVQCCGVSDAHIATSRRAVAKAVGTGVHGRQVDRALLIDDVAGSHLDPAFEAHVLPLMYLALAWWENWVQPHILQEGLI